MFLWPHISPTALLLVVIGVTLLALTLTALTRRTRRSELAALARQWRMNYTPRDTFNLAARIGPHLPVPGAADISVCDLIYGTEEAQHRYIFSAEYTVGIVRAKRRERCVMCVSEPRGHGGDLPPSASSLRIARPDLPLLDQYRSLHGAEANKSTGK